MKKLVYVGFAYRHHKGTHAGYHHVKDFLQYDKIIDCQKEFEFLFFEKKYASIFKRILRRVYAIVFGDGCPCAMLRALVYSWMHKGDVTFHIIYGDNIYARFFYKFRRSNHKVVATVHQPLERYNVNKKYRNKLLWPDHLIILATNELNEFKKITGKDNVTYIPHGICTDYYMPDENIKQNGSVLMVGNWLRNFELAKDVFKKIKEEFPEIIINMVGNPVRKDEFSPYVNYYSCISDDALLKLYRESSVMYLPITRFTANNSLLEAGAAGCNILIATSNPDDNTYIPNEYINFCNTSVDDNVSTIVDNIHKASVNNELRKYVIENFSWHKISDEVEQLLKSI